MMTISELTDEFETTDTVPGLPKRRTHKAVAERNRRMLALLATGMTIEEVAASEGITRNKAYGGLAKMPGYRAAMTASRLKRYGHGMPAGDVELVDAHTAEESRLTQRLDFTGATRRPGETWTQSIGQWADRDDGPWKETAQSLAAMLDQEVERARMYESLALLSSLDELVALRERVRNCVGIVISEVPS